MRERECALCGDPAVARSSGWDLCRECFRDETGEDPGADEFEPTECDLCGEPAVGAHEGRDLCEGCLEQFEDEDAEDVA